MYACVCARARASVCACTSQVSLVRLTRSYRPAKGAAPLHPYFFFTTHSLSLSLSFSPQIRRRARYSTMLPASFAIPSRGVSVGEVRCEPAPNEAQRAPPVIFLKDLSTAGKYGEPSGRGTAGQRVLDAAKGFLARGRQEGRALPPLRNPSSLFCANSSTLDRGSLLEELADVILLKDDSSPCSYREYLKYFVELKVTIRNKNFINSIVSKIYMYILYLRHIYVAIRLIC